jgi:hypothetical protein
MGCQKDARQYRGIRGLDSCFGNALFKRAAADQDFLDALEAKWSGTWRIALFWVWHALDYGRSLPRIAVIGFGVAALYGFVFDRWSGLLDYLPIQLAQAAQPPREAAGHGWHRRAGCQSLADRR